MTEKGSRILIVDEYRFSRICSALLDSIGYVTAIASNKAEMMGALSNDDIGLVVTSYPIDQSLQKYIREKDIPSLVLSDRIDDDLPQVLKRCRQSICMIKPLDYNELRDLVRQSTEGTIRFDESLRFV